MLHESLACVEELAGEGWEIEVIDLRSVKPLDTDTVLASVARTGYGCCVVGEAWPWGGVTAEVIARVATAGRLPSARRAAACASTPRIRPIPYHPNLWKAPTGPRRKTIASSQCASIVIGFQKRLS